MSDLCHVREHAKILGADGVYVGTVDRCMGDRIRLAKDLDGLNSDNHLHHHIPASLIDAVENGIVWLREKASKVVFV
jgi:hypothetical protein